MSAGGGRTHTPAGTGPGRPGSCPLPGRPRPPASLSSRACPVGRDTPLRAVLRMTLGARPPLLLSPPASFRPSLRLPLRALRPGPFSLNALVENALWRPHPLATTPPGVRNTQSHRGSWAVWTVPPCAGPGGGYGDPGTYRGHVLALAACAVSSLAWGGERLPWALQSRPALWLGKEGWICFV